MILLFIYYIHKTPHLCQKGNFSHTRRQTIVILWIIYDICLRNPIEIIHVNRRFSNLTGRQALTPGMVKGINSLVGRTTQLDYGPHRTRLSTPCVQNKRYGCFL